MSPTANSYSSFEAQLKAPLVPTIKLSFLLLPFLLSPEAVTMCPFSPPVSLTVCLAGSSSLALVYC